MCKSRFLYFIVSVFFVCSFFCSCTSPQEPEKPAPIPEKKEKTILTFVNNSSYDVSVYYGSNPYSSSSSFVEVESKQTVEKEIEYNSNYSSTFYYVYNLTFPGSSAYFPYFPDDERINHKSLKLEEDKINYIYIDEIEECKTKSAYIFLENGLTSDIYLLLSKHTPVNPYKKESKFLKTGMTGAYEINSENTITFDNIQLLSLVVDSIEYPLPEINYERGSIYTITVSSDDSSGKTEISASLKAVTPFNIDTQNKIWSLDNSIFSTEYPVAMRPSYDGKATLVIGTARREPQKIGIGRIDEYGKYSTGTDNFVAFNDNPNHTATQIVDFVEQQDGSVVMLCNQIFKTSDITSENYVIVCYDFASKTPKWYKVIPSSVQVSAEDNSCYMLVFRNDSKNKLIQIAEDKFVCVGAYDNYAYNAEDELDYDRLHYMIMYIDGTNTNSEHIVAPEAIKTIISTDYSDLMNAIERNLTSAYFDGTDLFICGYENWNHPVKNEKGEIDDEGYNTTHVGKIWKVPLSDIEAGNCDFENNVVYSYNNCLFFSIDGTGKNYVVCGEYKDTGKVLKGCHVTSSMIKADSSCTPVKYTVPGKQSCWFNQLCQYGSKIVLCGKAADSFDGSESPLPFVVAYDSKGNKLWENLSFTNYTSALNIIPNTIGTYMLQLEGKNGIIHYVNADLLGNEKK